MSSYTKKPSIQSGQKKINQPGPNPLAALDNFFSYAHLPEAKLQLWEWLKTTVAGNYNRTLNARERSDILYFYEQLLLLLDAAYQLHTAKK